jgi:hypothetical protein
VKNWTFLEREREREREREMRGILRTKIKKLDYTMIEFG